MLENSRDSANNGHRAVGFERYSFNEKMIRFQHRGAAGMCTLENATIANSVDIFSRIRGEIVIASDAAVAAVLEKNPMTVKRVCFSGKPAEKDGIFAYLPLNRTGVAALLSGAFDGLQPDPLHIAPPREQPEAIYIWLIYMPHHGGRAIGALGELIDIAAPTACPIFSKAINLHAQQLNDSLGFMPAQNIYPNAPSPLLVVLPRKDLEVPKKQSTEVKLVRDLGDYTKIIAIRSATYIAEQFCHFDEEFDGNDLCATHWIGFAGSDPAGCIRARFFNSFAKIERLAVRSDYRNSRLAYQLVREAIKHCQRKGYRTLYGHSRLDLVRFWRVFGFRPLANKAPFDFADVRYVEMVCTLDSCADAITLDADPMVLIRPEGAWDTPGPFDNPPARWDTGRQSRIAEATRTVADQDITF
jgi:predicted GNAT family N-acyltransferase